MPGTVSSRRLALAVGCDVGSVVAFVAVGRRNHDESGALFGVLGTALPFLIGLAVGWVVARGWRRPAALSTGLVVWPTTVAVGMLLRNLVFDRGTAASFVVVATVAVGVLLTGWRVAAALVDRRRAGRLSRPAT